MANPPSSGVRSILTVEDAKVITVLLELFLFGEGEIGREE